MSLGVFDFKKEPKIITFSTSGCWESFSTIYFLRFDLVSSFDEIELSKVLSTKAVIALFLNFYLQINTIPTTEPKVTKKITPDTVLAQVKVGDRTSNHFRNPK
jgi:hypothetical protein